MNLNFHSWRMDRMPQVCSASGWTGLEPKTGRTFQHIPLWGRVEDKLANALDNIWEDVLAESQPDIDAIMSRHLDPLARRLQQTLSG